MRVIGKYFGVYYIYKIWKIGLCKFVFHKLKSCFFFLSKKSLVWKIKGEVG